MLVFQDISYSVGDKPILRNITLQVERGETLVLLGRSGSGKTTLLKMVNRLIEPTSGEVVLEGKALQQWDPIVLRRSIGYVIQDGGLFPHFTAAANVALVPTLLAQPANEIEARVALMLNAVGLPYEEYRQRYPRQLSGGQKQRVGIARALAADPKLLLLDEPFAALDPVTRLELQRHFLKLRQEMNKTSLFVTHDVREALLIGSRIAVLHDGMLETVLPAGEFIHAQTSEARAFLETLQ
ncbi:MAG: ATP-binding cassette domain-containing protein [Bryobacteraceae bacterium]